MFSNRRYTRFFLKHRMLIFLIVSCLLILMFPFSQQQLFIPTFAVELLYNFFIIVAIYLISTRKQIVAVAVFISLMAVSIIWFDQWILSKPLLLTGLAMEMVLFGLAIVLIIQHVLRYKKITEDKLYGAISAYLLIGINWALLYTFIEIYHPGSFEFGTNYHLVTSDISTHRFYFSQFLYLSYVTLSTLGYGDIAPLSPEARLACSLEAVTGQLYVAVLIARLVGVHITHTATKHK